MPILLVDRYVTYKEGEERSVQASGKNLSLKFPRSKQTFQGFLFTGDGQAIAGTSHLAEREAGSMRAASRSETPRSR